MANLEREKGYRKDTEDEETTPEKAEHSNRGERDMDLNLGDDFDDTSIDTVEERGT